MGQPDLILLHPPSVYDFRKRAILYGPVSDLIPSSPVFEMYPLGFLTIADYLEKRGMEVRIVNLALRMMNDRQFDVPRFLAQLKPKAFGIDLHWLPHAHGSVEVARLVKQIHPEVPVIFGGMSATYFHEELIRRPEVDYVLRGDSVESPLYELMTTLSARGSAEGVPNLTWKSRREIRVNPQRYSPLDLDHADVNPDRMVKMVLRYRDLQSVLPFNGWWQNPITAVFTAKGCAHRCVTCGGSRDACTVLNARDAPTFRSPRSLVKDVEAISQLSRGPIFLVGDLRQGGDHYADEVLRILSKASVKNRIVFELFDMPSSDYLRAIDRSVQNWSLELSPESHDAGIRAGQDEAAFYWNEEMEAVIGEALDLRCERIDVFFMIGLPYQTRQSVMDTVRYCEHLFRLSDPRLSCFISPLGPFLDPGSRAFEDPERFGYRLFARSLEEHRQLLLQPSWKGILNYETLWMDREYLVEATYDAAQALNAAKMRYGRIARSRGEAVAHRITRARALKDRLEEMERRGERNPDALEQLEGDIYSLSVSTVCDKRELFWRRHVVNFRPLAILRILLSYLRERLGAMSRRKPGSGRALLGEPRPRPTSEP